MARPSLRRLLQAITPPVLWRVVRTSARGSRNAWRSTEASDAQAPLSIPPGGPKALNYVIGETVFAVPTARVRYPDGRPYTHDEHHFLQYYRFGDVALRRFYEHHQPTDLFERHFLAPPTGVRLPVDGYPWFESFVPFEDRGEAGLGPEHGNQAYGPVSERKLSLEAERLDTILASIERHGFLPGRGGYVQGFFMLRSDGDWVFVVWTGFHRMAAMAHLGFESVQARFNPGMPRFVEESDVAAWPMVRSGLLTADEALRVFAQYFRGDAAKPGADTG